MIVKKKKRYGFDYIIVGVIHCTLKPLKRKTYGSIPHLSSSRLGEGDYCCNEGQERIATKKVRDIHDLIIVQEKLDGSCVGVYKPEEGTILPLVRSGYLASTSPYETHHLFDRWVSKNKDRFNSVLKPGERLVGEWLLHAVGTRYCLPHEPFVAFDIMIDTDRMVYHDFLLRVRRQNFIVPELIHIGQPIGVNHVLKHISTSGHGAIDPVEGAIWRVERNNKVDFLIKYVRHDKEDGKYFAEKPILNSFVDIFYCALGEK